MPNLAPPVLNAQQALAYRERILAALPPGARFCFGIQRPSFSLCGATRYRAFASTFPAKVKNPENDPMRSRPPASVRRTAR